jgi:hypothetical protein
MTQKSAEAIEAKNRQSKRFWTKSTIHRYRKLTATSFSIAYSTNYSITKDYQTNANSLSKSRQMKGKNKQLTTHKSALNNRNKKTANPNVSDQNRSPIPSKSGSDSQLSRRILTRLANNRMSTSHLIAKSVGMTAI